jgi:hypothetical protein
VQAIARRWMRMTGSDWNSTSHGFISIYNSTLSH